MYENIQLGARPNFDIVNSSNQSAWMSTPFDASSIMMFGPHYFAVNDTSGRPQITIQPLKGGVDIR